MKKIISFALVILMLIPSLISCADNASESSSLESSSVEPSTESQILPDLNDEPTKEDEDTVIPCDIQENGSKIYVSFQGNVSPNSPYSKMLDEKVEFPLIKTLNRFGVRVEWISETIAILIAKNKKYVLDVEKSTLVPYNSDNNKESNILISNIKNEAFHVHSVSKDVVVSSSVLMNVIEKLGYTVELEIFNNDKIVNLTIPYTEIKGYSALYYTLSADKTYYIVDGVKKSNDQGIYDIVIPLTYRGLPIKRIRCLKVVKEKNYEEFQPLYEDLYDDDIIPNYPQIFDEEKPDTFVQENELPVEETDKEIIDDPPFYYTEYDQSEQMIRSVYISDTIEYVYPNALQELKYLEKITVSPDNVNYKSMGDCLYSEDEHTLVSVPRALKQEKFTIPYGVWYISDKAFKECDKLSEVVLPESVLTIGEDAFSYCTSLLKVNLPSSLEKMGTNAFYNCTKLVEVVNESFLTLMKGADDNGYVAKNAISINTSKDEPSIIEKDGEFYFITVGDIKKLVLYSGNGMIVRLPTSVEKYELCDNLFMGNSEMIKLVIPSNVTKIGENSLVNCKNLEQISVSNINDILKLTHIDYKTGLFSNGSDLYIGDEILETLIIPEGVTEINSYAFRNCSSIKKVILPNSLTKIGEYAFAWCVNLAEIKFNEGLTTIENYAFSSSGLKELHFPSTVTVIEKGTFNGCLNLEELFIPKTITTLSSDSFANCNALKSVKIESTGESIPQRMFANCTSLEKVEIALNIKRIGDSAFGDCRSLDEFSFHKNLEYIGHNSFSGCKKLNPVWLREGIHLQPDSFPPNTTIQYRLHYD